MTAPVVNSDLQHDSGTDARLSLRIAQDTKFGRTREQLIPSTASASKKELIDF